MSNDRQIRELARQQLDSRLETVRQVAPSLRAPEGGWVNTIRSAHAMSQGDLARRMNVSQQAVSQLERREAMGAASLNALAEAAHALDCEFVYALVPRRSIQAKLEARALRLAEQMLGSVRHSMRLEDQEPRSELEERTTALAKELMASPDRLWGASLDE